jgi:1-acyl-sn-glycerol-3-phosphate acyltransferase
VRSWFYWPGTGITGFLARVLWHARVEGDEHIPREGAFILVSNHCSNLDPEILGWAIGYRSRRLIHFMAKVEMRTWPVIGWLASQSGVYFVRRGEGDRAAQRFSLQALGGGRPIALFPEGTRSRDGRLKSFKSGAAFLAMRSGAPILPVGIAGTHRLFPDRSKLPHPSRVIVRVGARFTLPHVADGRIDREVLAEGTERILSEVEALLPVGQRRAVNEDLSSDMSADGRAVASRRRGRARLGPS